MGLTFNLRAFLAFVLLFLVEVYIAMYVSNVFVRSYLGDTLVVILMFCFVRAFTNIKSGVIIWGLLFFSFAVEFAQYFRLADVLNIKNKVMRIIIGTSYSFWDLVAYTAGAILCIPCGSFIKKMNQNERIYRENS